MTITRKLGLAYAALALFSSVLVIQLGYHEFVAEPREFALLGLSGIHKDTRTEFWAVLFLSLMPFLLGTGWWWIYRVLSPLRELSSSFEVIDADHLRMPLPRSGMGDEVDRLASVFNAMISRLDVSFRDLRALGVSASHELRTPLTVMRAQLETVLREKKRGGTISIDWVESQLDEVRRLTGIVDSIMLLARADAWEKIEHLPVGFGGILQEAVHDAEILGESAGIRILCRPLPDLRVSGDRDRLRQLLLILTENAVKYNGSGGMVEYSLEQSGEDAILGITNSTETQPQGPTERLFEPFARGEEGGGGHEGAGMGLAIAKWIVRAHGGTIGMETFPGRVSVWVKLPLARTDAGSRSSS